MKHLRGILLVNYLFIAFSYSDTVLMQHANKGSGLMWSQSPVKTRSISSEQASSPAAFSHANAQREQVCLHEIYFPPLS